MEFWCLIKEYLDYDDFDRDVTVKHYATEFAGLDEFFRYVNKYVKDYELEEDGYKLGTEGDEYYFSFYDEYTSISVTLEKINL